MRIFVTTLILSASSFAQTLSYSPAQVLEKTVSLTYYNTEYIFITNNSDQSLDLSFELIDENLPQQWSATGCTNMICYTNIPDNGSLGVLQPGHEAYLSINLSVNEVIGDGELKFAVFDLSNPQVRDTVSFIYHVTEDLSNQEPQPWAKINFAQNVITVFLLNESVSTFLYVFDLQGNQVVNRTLQEISAVTLAAFPVGIYVVVVRDESGKELVQKIVKS
jgi:hypothetical protein